MKNQPKPIIRVGRGECRYPVAEPSPRPSRLFKLISDFGSRAESMRVVIAHKAFLQADAMLKAYEERNWEGGSK